MIFSPSAKRRLQLRITERRVVIMVGDAAAVIAAVVAALAVWARVAEYAFSPAFVVSEAIWFVVLPPMWMLLAAANDFYELPVASNRLVSFQRLVRITGQLLVIYLIVFFFSPRDALPRLFIFYYGIASFVFIGLWRMAMPSLIDRASEARLILIIGIEAEEIINAIRSHAQTTYAFAGIIGEGSDVGKLIAGVPVVGTAADLMNFVRRDRISELVLTSSPHADGELFQAVMDAYESGVALVPMPLLFERITGRVPVEQIRNYWTLVLPTEGESIFTLYPLARRAVEIGLCAVGMAVFAALLPLLALAIKLNSPGTIFYHQERVGLNGRAFRIIKFRTMVQDAEAQTGAVFSKDGDPRVTRVGRLMRKTRLDEIPQLINILRGDMSLIGPRPERPEHVRRLTEKIPFYRTRLTVRPGLTGWAQVRYGYGSTDEDALVKLQYDLYYIRHQSLWLDLNILLRTVGRVLKMTGV